MEIKTCKMCNESKNISCFARNLAIKDGFDSRCRSCIHQAYKKRKESKKEPI